MFREWRGTAKTVVRVAPIIKQWSSIEKELNEIAIQRIQKNFQDALKSLVAGNARR
jgi:hypothetical protein